MPQVLVGGDAEQLAACGEAGGKLKVRQIGASVAAAQPVLLLGEIVVAYPGAMQAAQRLLGRAEIGDVAMRLCQMQCDAIDETAHQRVAAGPKQFRANLEACCEGQCPAVPAKDVAARNEGPPVHLIEPSQPRIDFTCSPAKTPALNGGKQVALQQ